MTAECSYAFRCNRCETSAVDTSRNGVELFAEHHVRTVHQVCTGTVDSKAKRDAVMAIKKLFESGSDCWHEPEIADYDCPACVVDVVWPIIEPLLSGLSADAEYARSCASAYESQRDCALEAADVAEAALAEQRAGVEAACGEDRTVLVPMRDPESGVEVEVRVAPISNVLGALR